MNDLYDYISKHDLESSAFIDTKDRKTTTYKDLKNKVDEVIKIISKYSNNSLAFLQPQNSVDAIVIYIASLKLGLPIALLEPDPLNTEKLSKIYKPQVLFLPEDVSSLTEYKKIEKVYSYNIFELGEGYSKVHNDLALLLQTSGSTDNPKLVRLSKKNIVSNAKSIVEYLNITKKDISIQSLPIQYSYGLSLVNSHIVAGAATILTANSFMRPEFWSEFNDFKCTSFAGVPFMYETLSRLRFDPSKYETLKVLTQAGGKLSEELVQEFSTKSEDAGCKFYVMYGQTEATARMSYVPSEKLKDKIGSVGIAIPGGSIDLKEVDSSESKEIVYKGDNVMMGYAECASDLEKGDELNGVLHTGDLANVDEEGYLYIVGRLKRFLKLFGKRINLQDVETSIEKEYQGIRSAAVGTDKELIVYIEVGDEKLDLTEVKNLIAKNLKITPVAVKVKEIDQIPMTGSGKKNYKELVIK